MQAAANTDQDLELGESAVDQAKPPFEVWIKRARSTEPIDFSFLEPLVSDGPNGPQGSLCHVRDILSKEPRKKKKIPRAPGSKRPVSRQSAASAQSTGSQYECALSVTTSIRLNNNKLTNIEGLQSVAPLLKFAGLEQLLWLDLSFNELVEIDMGELLSCPNLTVLYLHKNNLGQQERAAAQAQAQKKLDKRTGAGARKNAPRVSQPWLDLIDNLAGLKRLQNLSLFANPVEDTPNYRFRVLSSLPQLKKLDFSPVTPQARGDARQWAKGVAGRKAWIQKQKELATA